VCHEHERKLVMLYRRSGPTQDDGAAAIRDTTHVKASSLTEHSNNSGETSLPIEEADAVEGNLVERIDALWSAYSKGTSSIKRKKEQLIEKRKELDEQLYAYHRLLSRTGRKSKWRSFIQELGIPRATANRCVSRHKALVASRENGLTETISQPESDPVVAAARKHATKLKGILQNKQAFEKYVGELAQMLEFPRSTA
jgi:hypothetical protein